MAPNHIIEKLADVGGGHIDWWCRNGVVCVSLINCDITPTAQYTAKVLATIPQGFRPRSYAFSDPYNGYGRFEISANGTLTYLPYGNTTPLIDACAMIVYSV